MDNGEEMRTLLWPADGNQTTDEVRKRVLLCREMTINSETRTRFAGNKQRSFSDCDERVGVGALRPGGGEFNIFGHGNQEGEPHGLGNQLENIWMVAGVIAIGGHLSLLWLFGYWPGPMRTLWTQLAKQNQLHQECAPAELESHQSSEVENLGGSLTGTCDFFAQFSVCTAVAFAASGFRSVVGLFFADGKQRPAQLCTVLVSVVASHSHLVISRSSTLTSSISLADDDDPYGPDGLGLPVWRSCEGRQMHAARFAEWTPMIFFMMCLLNSLHCPSWSEFAWSTGCQVCYSVSDLLSKFMFVNVMSEAHLRSLSPEAAIRRELDLKRRANEAQKQFLRYVFHEVRVPLNTIRLGLQSLDEPTLSSSSSSSSSSSFDDSAPRAQPVGSDESEGADAKFILGCMDEAVTSMSNTLDDVLSYQKMDEGKIELSPAPFELIPMLQHTAFGLESAAKDKGLGLVLEVDPSAPGVAVGDVTRLRQVLNNFASNATKFSKEGNGSLAIRLRVLGWGSEEEDQSSTSSTAAAAAASAAANSTSRSSSSSTSGTSGSGSSETAAGGTTTTTRGVAVLEFSVEDKGVGISAEDMGKLFQPFSQIRAGDLQSGRGSGLGLCICKHMIHLMGGGIGVRSSLGKGSTFFFVAPLPVAASNSTHLLLPVEQATTTTTISTSSTSTSSNLNSNSPVETPSARPALTPISIRRAARPPSLSGTVSLSPDEPESPDFSPHPTVTTSTSMDTGILKGSPRATTTSSSSPRFVVTPAVPPAAVEPGQALESFDSFSAAEAWRSELKVLVVDDVTTNRKMVKRLMAKLGFTCSEAVDGVEAVERFEASRFDLVLMDNVMPRLTGVEAAAIIRTSEKQHRQRQQQQQEQHGAGASAAASAPALRKTVTIFGITGNALSEDVAEFAHAGCDEVLTKPLEFAKLKALLEKHNLLNPPT